MRSWRCDLSFTGLRGLCTLLYVCIFTHTRTSSPGLVSACGFVCEMPRLAWSNHDMPFLVRRERSDLVPRSIVFLK
jgi:hypothetical protein